jgi:hypothetical protein
VASAGRGEAALRAIRCQRAEVEALIEYRCAPRDSARAASAWWRAQQARRERLPLLLPAEAAALAPLPAPPPQACTKLQVLLHKVGLLDWERAAMPARLARAPQDGAGPAR